MKCKIIVCRREVLIALTHLGSDLRLEYFFIEFRRTFTRNSFFPDLKKFQFPYQYLSTYVFDLKTREHHIAFPYEKHHRHTGISTTIKSTKSAFRWCLNRKSFHLKSKTVHRVQSVKENNVSHARRTLKPFLRYQSAISNIYILSKSHICLSWLMHLDRDHPGRCTTSTHDPRNPESRPCG